MPGGLEVPGGPQGRVAQVAGEGMLTLEVPRGREGLCGHHGGRSLASLVISAICRVWVKIEIRTRERIQRAADRRKVMGQ